MRHPFKVGQRVRCRRYGAPRRVVMVGFVKGIPAVGTVPEAMWKRGKFTPTHGARPAERYRAVGR
jgi:hypothetical protein